MITVIFGRSGFPVKNITRDSHISCLLKQEIKLETFFFTFKGQIQGRRREREKERADDGVFRENR